MRLGTKGLIQITGLPLAIPCNSLYSPGVGEVGGGRCAASRLNQSWAGSWGRAAGEAPRVDGGGTRLLLTPAAAWPCWPATDDGQTAGAGCAVWLRDDKRCQRSPACQGPQSVPAETDTLASAFPRLTWLNRQPWLCSCHHLPPPLLSVQQS